MKYLGKVIYGDNYQQDLVNLVGSPFASLYDQNVYLTPYFKVHITEDGRAIKVVQATERDEIYEFKSWLHYHRHKLGLPAPETQE